MKPKRERNKEFSHIGGLLQNVLRDFHGEKSREMMPIFDIWEEAVKDPIARNTRPVAFKENILCIHVTSSSWMHHLQFLKPELIAGINQALGKELIRDLLFKIGPV